MFSKILPGKSQFRLTQIESSGLPNRCAVKAVCRAVIMQSFLPRFAFPLTILVVLLVSSVSSAQSARVVGTLTNADGDPLPAAAVTLKGTDISSVTTKDGAFELIGVEPGTYTLIARAIGHKVMERDIIVTADDTLELSYVLEIEPVIMESIVIVRTSLVGNKERLFRIPGSAHYLEAAELQKFELNDIHHVLREVPGVNIQEEDGYGLRPNIGFRGTGVDRSSKITLMEDGILIAPAPYSAPSAYYFPTVGRMNGIEVRKGSSQVKYGPYTTGGALNLVSTPIPDDFSGRVELLAGEDAARRLHAIAGLSIENFGFVVETFQENVDGFKNLDGGGDTGFDKKDYMVKARLRTNPDAAVYQQVEVKYGLTDEESNETYLGLTDADFDRDPYRRYAASREDLMDADHEQFHIRHFIKPTDALDITTTFYRTDFHRNWYKLDKVRARAGGDAVGIRGILEDPATYSAEYDIITGQSSPNDDALMLKANNREYYAQGIESILGVKRGVHELEIGLRFHEDQIDRFQWVDEYQMTDGVMMLTDAGTPGTESNRIGEARAWAGYAQFSLSFGKLTAVPGVRYENITLTRDDYGKSDPDRTGVALERRENEVDVFIPGLGIDYQFTPRVSGFGSIHKGFAPPGSSPDTEPEESINYEIGGRYRAVDMSLQGVIFFADYNNLLGTDLAGTGGMGSGDLFNGGKVEVKGLELSASYTFASGRNPDGFLVPIRFAYTFTDGEFKNAFESDYDPWGTVNAGDELPYLPRHQMALAVGLERSQLAVNVSAKYVGEMRTVAGQGDIIERESTDAHFLLGASADYAITNTVKLFAGIRNLTDEVYIAARRPAGVRPGLPRTINIGIKTEF